MTASARLLGGSRLHLQHGPIDLIIWAEGAGDDARVAREIAYRAAQERFAGLLQELVDELPLLRRRIAADAEVPLGETARIMDAAVRPFADVYLTRMASVAGAVAQTILAAMCRATELNRAYVNNGGDIALHLTPGTRFDTAILGHNGMDLGRITIRAQDGIRGIATSARHGRSLSLGIADSVTVLARSAAEADAAATLIANAVDLPGNPAIRRCPANALDPDSDLGSTPVVTGCGALAQQDVSSALANGLAAAQRLEVRHHIEGAALFLQGQASILGHNMTNTERSLVHA